MKKHNFCAGPCTLPREVFQKASEAVLDYNGTGLSILEISHRSKEFQEIMDQSRQMVKDLMGIDEAYEVLFLQGGASLQFSMVPLNLSRPDEKPAYVQTGKWADNAFIEAEKMSRAEIVASSKDADYTYIPKEIKVSSSAPYLHITSNNTIYGTQFKQFPTPSVPLVCDMSSDIFSREIDYTAFDLIYAGAQKNVGTAGTTLVVVKKEILKDTGRTLPSYLDYRKHIQKGGIFNTPPVFSIYTSYVNLLWLKKNGGIPEMEKRNKAKSTLLYQEIDRNPLFIGVAEKECRSDMNATFRLKDESLQEKFNQICQEADISGVQGHRSVGGYRASMYNALPIESVQILVDCMQTLEKQA